MLWKTSELMADSGTGVAPLGPDMVEFDPEPDPTPGFESDPEPDPEVGVETPRKYFGT
jgi:hypothetical protein